MITLFVFFAWQDQASAARLIRASVSYEGAVILEGGTSDDGYVDSDGVWEYLKKIKFTPTEAFDALKIDPVAKVTKLEGGGPGVALADCRITVSIAHGGSAKFRELTPTRVPKDKHGREWMLDPDEINKWFAYRMISRREASKLRRPGKLK